MSTIDFIRLLMWWGETQICTGGRSWFYGHATPQTNSFQDVPPVTGTHRPGVQAP